MVRPADKFAVKIAKVAKQLTKLRGGSGSALPGLIVEKTAPDFLRQQMSQIPLGTIVITGTNGKTTTTKVVVELLREQGLKVFTNDSGSNFARGVISALIPYIDKGAFDFDIAVIELDEAHAVKFVEQVVPRGVVVLNVFRDQLDRYAETDKTAAMLGTVAQSASDFVVLNLNDPLVANLVDDDRVSYFSQSHQLDSILISDAEMYNLAEDKSYMQDIKYQHRDIVVLKDFSAPTATFQFNQKQPAQTALSLMGIHSALNCAAALATVAALSDTDNDTLSSPRDNTLSSPRRRGSIFDFNRAVQSLQHIQPAFGRGEIIELPDGTKVELELVKNPAGFKLVLDYVSRLNSQIIIAINDDYADGRDVSWLWDVDFSILQTAKLPVVCLGTRAADMALRLQYDKVSFELIEGKLPQVLPAIKGNDKQIFCTYTALLQIRKFYGKDLNEI